ncbi:Fur family transcriptional regulator [Campylobacter pinnipediorum]|uniref:Ferric uptake regulation protein n=1 Tax=Campylobacter pinnipediorum subsp. pinnipediorum TaxID=1660067 RepID=A0AAX0L982_9BACT|nr:transcriptional repressor [Campylobacter pinnipediorum]AQW81855.1 peroxide stress transcriptional regulator PerR [Campylobacter pinnipediorum subsp. pinnipediorum]AQW83530.1 peroxide stress transcriptional regulator PerR [Campylobacter pinnipediorum subsp. pinnipediorum]AQW85051.1 peroxide stress transcriptional regulator PerR [Campylobacter pinnipediorum subsp. pinnipediorum]OPA76438.1 transcriptional repressor [Campylobacter pinnipediorum subsp. pinnipediorum]OPA79899.1 transcriptional re
MQHVSLLKRFGLKVTPQRLSVLKVLDQHTHPTIDELYEEIKKENPSVSLATVYKNLNTLKDEGLVVEVNIINQKPRYDIYEYPHIHVVCDNCGYVQDVSYDDAELNKYQENLEKKLGNIIERLNLVANVKTCKKCR